MRNPYPGSVLTREPDLDRVRPVVDDQHSVVVVDFGEELSRLQSLLLGLFLGHGVYVYKFG